MAEFLNKIIPNVMARTDIFWESFRDTFIMVGWAGGISFLIGIILGITLIVTRPSGIVPNQVIYQVIDKIVNFFRCSTQQSNHGNRNRRKRRNRAAYLWTPTILYQTDGNSNVGCKSWIDRGCTVYGTE